MNFVDLRSVTRKHVISVTGGVLTTALEEVRQELEEGAAFDDPDLLTIETALREEPDLLVIEAALTANARGVPLEAAAGTRPVPRMHFTDDALTGSLVAWGTNVAVTVESLVWSSSEVRHTARKGFLSLVVKTDSTADARHAPSEPAAAIVTTSWFHWDDMEKFEGRFTELDKDEGIVYRLFLSSAQSISLRYPQCSLPEPPIHRTTQEVETVHFDGREGPEGPELKLDTACGLHTAHTTSNRHVGSHVVMGTDRCIVRRPGLP